VASPDGHHKQWHLRAGDDKRHEEEHDHERQKRRTLAATDAARRRNRRHRHARLQLSTEVLHDACAVRVVLQHTYCQHSYFQHLSTWKLFLFAFGAFTLLVGRQEGHPACKKTEWWGAGVVVYLEQGADLLMPLPLTVSCFSKIQIGFTFLVPAHLGSPEQGPLNVCVSKCQMVRRQCQ